MAHLGNTIVNGSLRVLGGENVDTINGVTVGSSPKFTDTNNRKSFYGTCSTAGDTAAKTVTLSDTTGWELKAGTVVGVKFSNSNTASSCTLNVNGSGAKSIWYNTGVYTGNSVQVCGNSSLIIYYMYDGSTYWVWMGASRIWNDDTYNRNQVNGAIQCGTTAIVAGNIIVGGAGVYHHLKDGTSFNLAYPILYAGSNIAANATGTNNYNMIHFTVTTTQSITLTAYSPVYIKGILNGIIFTPISTTPLTQNAPTSDDGYAYIFLGLATSTNTIYLFEHHKIFVYKNGTVCEITCYSDSIDDYVMTKVVYNPKQRIATKNGADNWDGQIYSRCGYGNNVFVSFRIAQTNKALMIGLNSDPTSAVSNHYTYLDYAWYFKNNGSLAIYESNTQINDIDGVTNPTYAAGDEFRVEFCNGFVYYFWNNVLQRRKKRNIGDLLYFDSSFHGDAGAITDLTYGTIASSASYFSNRFLSSESDSYFYKINIDSSVAWMLSFDICIYANYATRTIKISGYNYGSNYWFKPKALDILQDTDGTSNGAIIDNTVYFGYDAQNKLWVAIKCGNYCGISIENVVNGFRAVNNSTGDYRGLFQITKLSELDGTTQTTIILGAHAEGYNTTATGTCSHAEGFSTYALGARTHAEGGYTTAEGTSSHAEGCNTRTSGTYSHAEGGYIDANTALGNFAEGAGSHAEGYNTTASSTCSHSEGQATCASGGRSHSEGSSTTAGGGYSHAEGYQTYANITYAHAEGEGSTASGQAAHAEGYICVAYGTRSHAEGHGTSTGASYSHTEGYGTRTASNNYTHAEGYQTTAFGTQSHAEGYMTSAQGTTSHAEGAGTTSANANSHASGHYNAAMTTGGSWNNTTGTAFVIGNGTAANALKNAFSVQFNGVVKAASTITASTTADYAEYFEWADENPLEEDRVGYFVTFDDGDKIRFATSEDDYILGIVSGEPFVLGNGDCDVWNGMVMRDDFRRVIYEPAPEMEEVEGGKFIPKLDKDGHQVYLGTRPVLNPDYDPSEPYISRADRPEWSPIGMLGVLAVRDDGTCQVNGYAMVSDEGIATRFTVGNQNRYRVIKRRSENVIEVVFR